MSLSPFLAVRIRCVSQPKNSDWKQTTGRVTNLSLPSKTSRMGPLLGNGLPSLFLPPRCTPRAADLQAAGPGDGGLELPLDRELPAAAPRRGLASPSAPVASGAACSVFRRISEPGIIGCLLGAPPVPPISRPLDPATASSGSGRTASFLQQHREGGSSALRRGHHLTRRARFALAARWPGAAGSFPVLHHAFCIANTPYSRVNGGVQVSIRGRYWWSCRLCR